MEGLTEPPFWTGSEEGKSGGVEGRASATFASKEVRVGVCPFPFFLFAMHRFMFFQYLFFAVGHSTSELSWRWQDDPRGLRLGPGLRRRAPGAASALTNIFTLDCSRIYPLKGE